VVAEFGGVKQGASVSTFAGAIFTSLVQLVDGRDIFPAFLITKNDGLYARKFSK
jgi:hypothetical protein